MLRLPVLYFNSRSFLLEGDRNGLNRNRMCSGHRCRCSIVFTVDAERTVRQQLSIQYRNKKTPICTGWSFLLPDVHFVRICPGAAFQALQMKRGAANEKG